MEGLASPYDDANLYDAVLDGLDFDLAWWLSESRAAQGPVLELGCGTGRILLKLLEAGLDAEGLDSSPAMLARLRLKAADRGLTPRIHEADMRDFRLPRRYAMAFIAFNSFGHCLTVNDQLRCLLCCREHLLPRGRFLLHMSYPGVDYWSQPSGVPVLEIERTDPVSGHVMRMYDTRTMDRVAQLQHSHIEIQELDAEGRLTRSTRFETRQRWVYRHELELLLMTAGFSRFEFFGGMEGEPLERDDQQMVVRAWLDESKVKRSG